MVSAVWISSLLLALGGAVVASPSNIVPGAFIVAVDPNAGSLQKRAPKQAVDGVISRIKGKGIPVNAVPQTFTNSANLFSGFSFTTTNVSIADIASVPGVTAVWPMRRYFLPEPVRTGDSGPRIQSNGAGAPVNSKRSLEDFLIRRADSDYATDNFSPHLMTGVNSTHAAGQLGQGIHTCLIDSGVDYKHPLLGGCFGPGCHVSTGYDFVGNDYTGENTPVPDPDPYTDCNEHGTHCSGIVAALANPLGFSGVAPDATLGMYRVFGCAGSVTDDIIISAMLRAASDSCNIISMSLGGPFGFTSSSPLTLLVDQFINQGIAVFSAMGNDGTEGLFYTSSPGSTLNGAAIGSIDVVDLPAFPATITTTTPAATLTVPYLDSQPMVVSPALPIKFLSTDPTVTNDGCDPITQNLAGYVTIIRRGTCTFVQKLTNVKNAGGEYAVIYNAPNATMIPYVDSLNPGLKGAVSMTYDIGLSVLNAYKAASGNNVMWSSNTAAVLNNVVDTDNGGIMSYFSSYGPGADMYGYPTLSAPGGNILSTFPLSMSGYGVISGTSMATPFAAGAAAVIMAARKGDNLNPLQIRSLLSTTSKFTAQSLSDSSIRTVAEQGSGLIQVDKAVAARTFFSPDRFYLNDTQYFNGNQNLQIVNHGTTPISYTLDNGNVANAVGTYQNSAADDVVNPNPAVISTKPRPDVIIQPKKLTLAPGQTGTINLSFKPAKVSNGDASKLPIYSGFITVTEDSGQQYNLPYLGAAGNLANSPIIDYKATLGSAPLPALADASNNPITTDGSTYSIAAQQGPSIVWSLAFPTRQYNIDVVDSKIAFTPTVQNGALVASNNAGTYASVPTIGSIFSNSINPREDPANGLDSITWTGQYTPASGSPSQVGPGSYRVLFRALRLNSDPAQESSWDSWLSPVVVFTA